MYTVINIPLEIRTESNNLVSLDPKLRGNVSETDHFYIRDLTDDFKEIVSKNSVADGLFRFAGRFCQSDFDHLARVVPFVDRGCDIEAFVALQPHQPAAEHLREDFCDFGFADARFAFQEQRLAHFEGEEQRRRQRALGDVIRTREQRERVVNRSG